MTARNRLTNSQIVIMRSVHQRSGGRPVTLDAGWQREFVPNLGRHGLIEIWYRQSFGDWWIVALIGETVSDGDKVGALKREIVGECL